MCVCVVKFWYLGRIRDVEYVLICALQVLINSQYVNNRHANSR